MNAVRIGLAVLLACSGAHAQEFGGVIAGGEWAERSQTRPGVDQLGQPSLVGSVVETGICKPIVVLRTSEGGGRALPAAMRGFHVLRNEELGVPMPPQDHPTMAGVVAVNWDDLPPLSNPWIPIEWVDKDPRPTREKWVADCPWTKVREWLENQLCTERDSDGNLNKHYDRCRRFEGACALQYTTATWAAQQKCVVAAGKEHCWYQCTGFASVSAAWGPGLEDAGRPGTEVDSGNVPLPFNPRMAPGP